MQIPTSYSRSIVWSLTLLPGLISLAFLSATDFSSPGAWLNTLGRLSGIWGLALLLVTALLCCRVPGFDRPFGGLTKLWHLHHQLGFLAFLLLLAHPVLLALAAVEVSMQAAVATLLSPSAAVIWGLLALLALMVFMAPTFSFFGDPEYQRWKWMHRLSGITVVFALIHTLMLNRTLPGLWGSLVWGLLAALALASISYRWLFSLWHGRQRYRVSKVEHTANNVVEISLHALERPLHYEPGQFVYLTPYDRTLANGFGEEHSYTLSSSPDEPVLRIAIKALGDASHALQSITPGSEVTIEGPYGSFFPVPDSPPEPELWIAGGIGITPFVGRLRHCVQSGSTLNVQLIYCVQDETRLLFGDELVALLDAIPGSHLHMHYFYREGPLSREFIEAHCPDFTRRTAYLCGPTSLITLAQSLLLQNGVATKQIVTEELVLL